MECAKGEEMNRYRSPFGCQVRSGVLSQSSLHKLQASEHPMTAKGCEECGGCASSVLPLYVSPPPPRLLIRPFLYFFFLQPSSTLTYFIFHNELQILFFSFTFFLLRKFHNLHFFKFPIQVKKNDTFHRVLIS